MKKTLVVGSTNTDMVISNRVLPRPGETISGGSFMLNWITPNETEAEILTGVKVTESLTERLSQRLLRGELWKRR